MWYQRWRQESSETLSSATHMFAAAIWVLVGCGGLGVSAVGILVSGCLVGRLLKVN
jgi:hypothetical protein